MQNAASDALSTPAPGEGEATRRRVAEEQVNEHLNCQAVLLATSAASAGRLFPHATAAGARKVRTCALRMHDGVHDMHAGPLSRPAIGGSLIYDDVHVPMPGGIIAFHPRPMEVNWKFEADLERAHERGPTRSTSRDAGC